MRIIGNSIIIFKICTENFVKQLYFAGCKQSKINPGVSKHVKLLMTHSKPFTFRGITLSGIWAREAPEEGVKAMLNSE